MKPTAVLLLASVSSMPLLHMSASAQSLTVTRLSGGQTRILTRSVTSTSDTISPNDCGRLVSYSNPGAIAVTLPLPASLPSGCWIDVQNTGAGAATITPTTSTIDGVTSLALATNQGARIVNADDRYLTQHSGNGLPAGCSASNSQLHCDSGFTSGITASPGEVDLFDAGSTHFTGLRAPGAIANSFVRLLSPVPPAAGQISQFTGVGSGAKAGTITFNGGGIDSIALTDGGSGYGDVAPIVTISGDGTGALAHATVANGVVTSIMVDAAGTGYSTAGASIIPVTKESFVAQPADSTLPITDTTTNNASTSKHGFAPKLPNDPNVFYNGIGTFTTPAGSGGGSIQDATTFALFGWGDVNVASAFSLSNGGATRIVSWAFTPPAMKITKFAFSIDTACGGPCGYFFSIMSGDWSTVICQTATSTDGTTGSKVLGFVSGTGVSGGVCTVPNEGLNLVTTSDDAAVAIHSLYGSNAANLLAQSIQAGYGGYTTAAPYLATGSGANLALPLLNASAWYPIGSHELPLIVVGR